MVQTFLCCEEGNCQELECQVCRSERIVEVNNEPLEYIIQVGE